MVVSIVASIMVSGATNPYFLSAFGLMPIIVMIAWLDPLRAVSARAGIRGIVSLTPDVDVVIALHRPGTWIDACLESVVSQRDVAVRTILVDDDPSSPLAASLAAAMPNGVAITTTRNRGFAAANNAGIAAGDAPFVLCLNQDARLAADYLARLVAVLESSPRVGSASGKILRVHSPTGRTDGIIDSAGLEMRAGRRAIDIGQGSRDDSQFDGQREVFGVSAAAAVYRRSALDAVSSDGQVFDESFFMYKEDVDLAWRLRRAGYGGLRGRRSRRLPRTDGSRPTAAGGVGWGCSPDGRTSGPSPSGSAGCRGKTRCS